MLKTWLHECLHRPRLLLVALCCLGSCSAPPPPAPSVARADTPAVVQPPVVSEAERRYLDAQEARLRERLADSGVQIVREARRVRVIIPGIQAFELGGHEIRDQVYPVLDELALLMGDDAVGLLLVTGHTDASGSAETNRVLSEYRAASMRDYLVARGVPAARTEARGLGAAVPLASNSTREGRRVNRRVEIEIRPQPSSQVTQVAADNRM